MALAAYGGLYNWYWITREGFVRSIPPIGLQNGQF